MSCYLVTGGAGFIGSNFVMKLRAEKPDATVINLDALTYAGNLRNLASLADDPRHVFVHADICDQAAVEAVFAEYQPDLVVNFAAESHVDRSIEAPQVFVETNVRGTVNLLECAKRAWQTGDGRYREGVRFLQVSTDEVYGSLGPEGFFMETTPLDAHSPYSASKAAADMLVKAYCDTYGFPALITRCSNNYGPYQFPEKLIPLMINNALAHKKLPVYGDGLQVRDWLYVEDHCAALLLALEAGRPGEVYNIGGHNERTNLQIVRTVIDYLRHEVDTGISEELIEHVTDRKGHDRRYGIDPSKIAAELGWEPTTPFELGIQKTIAWYLEHADWIAEVTSGAYQDYYREQYGNR